MNTAYRISGGQQGSLYAQRSEATYMGKYNLKDDL